MKDIEHDLLHNFFRFLTSQWRYKKYKNITSYALLSSIKYLQGEGLQKKLYSPKQPHTGTQ